MIRWTDPHKSTPECDVGDRVVGIVRYAEHYHDGFNRLPSERKAEPHVVVFIATEDGWHDVEGNGFDIFDCELWAMEKDVVPVPGDTSGNESDWEAEQFRDEYDPENHCPRCQGSGTVTTADYESYFGDQFKTCPECGGNRTKR